MLFSVDRIEGEFAVLIAEDKSSLSVPRVQLPDNAKEGNMVRLVDGQYCLDDDAAEARREQILRLQQKLRGKR